jgi:4-methyl-5(b-hydroxyethyl)-thiazole monophosphate biosynthesis
MHGTRVMVDKRLSEVDVDNYDGIVLPGGTPGHVNLSRSSSLLEMLQRFDAQGKVIAAICMGPSVLAKAGLLESRRATIYPGAERELPYPRGERIVIDSNIITSQAPGTAMEFSLTLVEHLAGQKMAERLKKDLVV